MKKRRRYLRLLNYVVSAAILAYVLWQLHPAGLLDLVERVHWPLFVLALSLGVVSMVLQAARWHFLLGRKMRYRSVLQVTYLGMLVNEVFPLHAGEFVRALVVSRRLDQRMGRVFSTQVMERVSDGVGAFLLVWFVASRLRLSASLQLGAHAFEGIIGFIVVGLAFIAWKQHALDRLLESWQPRRRPFHGLHRLSLDFLSGMHLFRNAGSLLVSGTVALTVVMLQVATIWVALRAFHLPLSLPHAAAVAALISLGTTLPNAPGNTGPWQFFCMLGLSLFGVEKSMAAGFATVMFTSITLVLVVGGVIALVLSPYSWRDLSGLRGVTDTPQPVPVRVGRLP